MKLMRLIPIAALALAPAAALSAQDTVKPTPPPQQEQNNPTYQQAPGQQQQTGDSTWYDRRHNALMQGITLTAEQQTKVDSIRKQFKDQLPAMPGQQSQRPNDPSNPEQQPPQQGQQQGQQGEQPDSATLAMAMVILDQQDQQIRTALNADQQRTFDRNKREWKQKQSKPPVG
jgi:hypothetical protein